MATWQLRCWLPSILIHPSIWSGSSKGTRPWSFSACHRGRNSGRGLRRTSWFMDSGSAKLSSPSLVVQPSNHVQPVSDRALLDFTPIATARPDSGLQKWGKKVVQTLFKQSTGSCLVILLAFSPLSRLNSQAERSVCRDLLSLCAEANQTELINRRTSKLNPSTSMMQAKLKLFFLLNFDILMTYFGYFVVDRCCWLPSRRRRFSPRVTDAMSHRKFERPRHGSLGFLPRKRTKYLSWILS